MVPPIPAALERAQARPGFLDLTDSRFHQNGLLPPRSVFDEAFKRYMGRRAYDPDSKGALSARQALSEHYSHEGWNLDPGRFLLTAGTSEAYTLLFSQFARGGDRVLLPRPGYPLFEHLARHSRLETDFYDQPESLAWQPDPGSVERAWKPNTRFLVVISPNNPTGQIIGEGMGHLAEICRKKDAILVCDEVFDVFLHEDTTVLPRPGKLFPDTKTFTLNGISKRFASPDWKLAWIAVSGPQSWCDEACARLDFANDAFLSANSFSQELLPDLFRDLGPFQDQMLKLIQTNRRTLSAWLEKESCTSRLPQAGIHGLLRVEGLPREWDDERLVLELLNRADLYLHPGFYYDLEEPGTWLVYSLLKAPDQFQKGWQRFSEFLKTVRN